MDAAADTAEIVATVEGATAAPLEPAAQIETAGRASGPSRYNLHLPPSLASKSTKGQV